MRHVIAFGWYGGKFSHLKWLLPLLPSCQHYCEPFGGSAAVLLNRDPSPVETYNDIDGEVVNFFQVLRDEKEALLEAIGLTPFSKAEFEKAISDASGIFGFRTSTAVLYSSETSENRTRTKSEFGTMGTLPINKPGRYGRCCVTVARKR